MHRIVSCRNYFDSKRETLVTIEKDDIDEIAKMLTLDNYYHSITSKNRDDWYLLYFDIDGKSEKDKDDKTIDIDDFITKMCSYINKIYLFKLKINNFSYTQNNKCINKYHVTLPSKFATIDEQKKLCKDFIKEYPEYGTYTENEKIYNIYDPSVYTCNRLFRLPNQSKGTLEEAGIHIIKVGKLQDFLLDNTKNGDHLMANIPDEDEIIEESEKTDDESEETFNEVFNKLCGEIEEKEISSIIPENSNKERIIKIINVIKKKRADEYNDWLKIGMIIKNELGDSGFNIFDDFSKLSKKYDGYDSLKNKWNSFKTDDTLKIGTLIMMAKEDNPKFFEKEMKNKIKQEIQIKKQEINDLIDKDKKQKENEELMYINMETDYSKFVNRFEDNDFTMVKFLRHISSTVFKNRKEAYSYICDNLHRVCALIGIRILIIKNGLICNSDQITFDNIETFGKDQLIKFNDMNPSKPVTLYKVLFTNRNFICRYEKISTDISYKNNNINEFYVTRPYVAKRIDYKIEELEFILEFIKHTMSNDNEEVYKSIINWLAWIVQFPDIKSGIVPVFVSLAGGTGKTKIIEFLYKFIIGEHLYAPVQDVGGVTDTQNKHLMGRKIVYVNEMATTREQFQSQFQKLKGLITEDIFKMKALFKDHMFLKNSLEFILTANTVDCIPQEKKQRRFFPIRFNSDRMNNFEYFAKFEEITYNEEYGSKFYSYLMDIPNLTIGIVRKFPITKLSGEMLENQMNSYDSFMEDLFNYQLMNIVSNSIKEPDNKYTIYCIYLFDQYMEYHKRLFSTTRSITYRKFISHIKSEDNEYKIVFNDRKNGKDKCSFTFILE